MREPLIIPQNWPRPYEMAPDMIQAITVLCKNPGRKMIYVPDSMVSPSFHLKVLCDWSFAREIGSYVFVPTKACRSFYWCALMSGQDRSRYLDAQNKQIKEATEGQKYYETAERAVETMQPITTNPWQNEDCPLRDSWNWAYLGGFEWRDEQQNRQLGWKLFQEA
jgi:hypothetical protein